VIELVKTLDRSARGLVTDAFLSGATEVDFSSRVREYPRRVRLESLEQIVSHAMGEFQDPVEADRWLAPRVHASLRITRREASDRNLWAYLGLVPFGAYVRWRFPSASAERYVGAENNHALGRLWWGAELIRNGGKYDDVVTAFRMQDIPNTWLRLDAFHHRPVAIAAVRVLGAWRGGEPATSDEVNALAKALNLELVTLGFDADVPDPGPTSADGWIDSEPDVTGLLREELPEGPRDNVVSDQMILDAAELLRAIAADVGLGASVD
jgi:hypothetical protein